MTVAERRALAHEMYARQPRPSMREIADELGVSVGTVHRDLNPEARERYRKAWRKKWGAQSGNKRNVTTPQRRAK